jgi:hypothetical protein
MTDVPTQPPDFNLRITQFIQLRDKIKEIKQRQKDELKPFEEGKDMLEAYIIQHLQAMKMEHAATEAGTAYLSSRVSATVKDMGEFWEYVLSNGLFDLVDKRANAPAVTEHIQKHGTPPPGINYSTMITLGVRRD